MPEHPKKDLAPIIQRIEAETAGPTAPQISAAARVVRAELGDAAVAVLFYGSALREGSFDGKVIDLYAVVDAYRPAYGKIISAIANAILPPNVFYLSTDGGGRTIRLKYAVISLDQFVRQAKGSAFTPYIWGRFAQPTAIVYARDDAVRRRLIDAIASAVGTMLGKTVPLMPAEFSSADLWPRAFSESYRTELRAEQKSKALELYRANSERYDALVREATNLDIGFRAGSSAGQYVGTASWGSRMAARAAWRLRRPVGKVLSLLRLIKAAFTFKGGVDYILWKIERHSGVKVTATEWQHRHPLMAAVSLFWRLYVKGGFR